MASLDNAIWINGATGHAESGSTTISDGTASTTVTGTFTADAWDETQAGYNISEFGAFGATSPISAHYGFSNPVENLAFAINHVNDDGATTYDDMWTIRAYDAAGALIPAADVIAALGGLVDENVIANADGSVSIVSAGTIANDVTVNLAGPVSAIELVFEPGPEGSATGGSGISDFSFDIPPPDHIVEGTGGDDKIDAFYAGDPEGDVVDGGDHSDGSDADSIEAGAGDDTVEAGAGDDTILAGDGADSVLGDDGDDLIDGGAGNDTVRGGLGRDTITGGLGNDSLYGNEDADSILAGAGDDSVYGETGDDFIDGGDGADHLEGNEGADTIFGGAGDDWIRASFGDDEIWGGTGDDYLWGGYGDDLFIVENDFGNDTFDAEGVDEIFGDTLDLSRVTDDLTIDLRGPNPEAGSFSDGSATATFDEIEHIILGGGRDTVKLADGSGGDTVTGFDMTDSGDGTTNDQLDVSGLTSDGGMTPVTTADVTVTDTNGDGSGDAILTFPWGESITLAGVPASQLDSPAALEAIGIPAAPSGTVHDAILLDGLPGDTDLLTVGSGLVRVEGGLEFAMQTPGAISLGDETVIGGTLYTVSGVHDYEADLVADGGTSAETVHGHIIELSDGAGGSLSYMLIDDSYGAKPDITQAQLLFVDPAAAGAPVASYDDDQAVSLIPGDFIVEGTAGADLIDAAYAGDPEGDRIDNGDHSDGSDADSIEAGAGDDTILAGAGDDTVQAGAGDDSIEGGDGNDSVFGFEGSDTVLGGDGDDWINTRTSPGTGIPDEGYADTSGSGLGYPADPDPANDRDSVDGGSGNDTILTGDDADTVTGGAGADSIDAGFDDDSLSGEAGADWLEGNEGNDWIDGGTENDVIHGDVAPTNGDYAVYAAYERPNDGSDDAPGNNADTLLGGDGDDTIFGQDDNDHLFGGSGDDHLDGGIDDDTLWGGLGADSMLGGDGDDHLFGELGDDTLEGGAGADSIAGGDGSDLADGGAGDDTIEVAQGDTARGGDGDDLFRITDLGEPGAGAITVIGGEDGETLGDTLDFQGLTHWDDITLTDTDPGAGGGLSGQATLADGSVVTFSEIENVVICFTAGTRITTDRGPRPVEDLRPGDMVVTRDHGLQPVRWAGRRAVPARGSLAPVRFAPGVLANTRPLVVSPQHRMLIEGPGASLLFGAGEVLASAKHLVNGGSVVRLHGGEVCYVHILFDRHEIVYAEGTPSESFFPGDIGLDAVDDAAREELFSIFPELRSSAGAFGETARTCLRAHESRLLRPG